MRRLGLIAVSLLGLCSPAPAQAPSGSSAITHVSVIDVVAGREMTDQTVVVENGRIARVGPASELVPPAGARLVDGRGRWLVPGLWDMHVHLSVPGGQTLLSLYPVFGVTGVRDMNDSFPEVSAWRRAVAAGRLAGPRIVAAGPYLVGQSPPLPHLLVRTADDGRRGVDSLRGLGVDFVKVHNAIPPEGYRAIASRIRELGWVFAGHVPRGITPGEAVVAGQRSLEHLTGFWSQCTPEEVGSIQPTGLINFLLGPCEARPVDPMIDSVRTESTWVTPTLTVALTVARADDTTRADSTDRYRSEGLRHLQTVVMRIPPMNREAATAAKFLFRKRQDLVRRMAERGVALLAGSDAPTPGAFPGFALHDELALLVQAGLTPAQALRAATLEPARYFSATDSAGTIAAGNVADLVLLDGNPLTDILNTRRIHAVWVAGRLYDPDARRRLLASAEAAAKAN